MLLEFVVPVVVVVVAADAGVLRLLLLEASSPSYHPCQVCHANIRKRCSSLLSHGHAFLLLGLLGSGVLERIVVVAVGGQALISTASSERCGAYLALENINPLRFMLSADQLGAASSKGTQGDGPWS